MLPPIRSESCSSNTLGACHDARRQIGMTQSPVPTRNRPSHLGTRAVCPCLQFNTKTPHPISVCLEHAPEAATPAQTKYLWVIERWSGPFLWVGVRVMYPHSVMWIHSSGLAGQR